MAKRRTKRTHEVTKRCDCRDQNTCAHPWWLRVKVKGEKRQRVNLSELFPGEAVDVAAARAKDLARKGLIKKGEIVAGQPGDTRLTCHYVAGKYIEARSNRKEQYYLDGLLAMQVPAGNGGTVTLGDKPIDDVLPRDLRKAKQVWQARPRAGANAIRHLLQTARHFFNWAITEEYATRTPFLSAQGKTLITIEKSDGRTRRLEDGEEDRILAATVADTITSEFDEQRAKTTDVRQLSRLRRREATAIADATYMRDFFEAMLKTGCRPGELRTLQWSEVQAARFVILASKAKDGDERKIPIRPALQKILDRRKLGPDGEKLSPDSFVFGDDTGARVSKEHLCEMWRLVCARAKVQNLHLHDLRGEFASRLAESKVPMHQVRDALGHANLSMTSAYLRTRTDSLDEAYAQLERHEARKRLKVIKGNGPRLAHDDSPIAKTSSS